MGEGKSNAALTITEIHQSALPVQLGPQAVLSSPTFAFGILLSGGAEGLERVGVRRQSWKERLVFPG